MATQRGDCVARVRIGGIRNRRREVWSRCLVGDGAYPMTSGRAARSLWTVATGLTFAATTTLMSLAVTPMLLRWLGTERFGLQRTLVDGVAYLGLFELGLLGATRANLALQYGAGNRAGAASYVRAALRGYVPVVALMACAGAAVWLAAPWFVTTRDVSSGEIRLALAIFLGAAFLAPLSRS